MFSRDGRYEMDVKNLIAAGNRVNEALAALMRRQNVSTTARVTVHNALCTAKRRPDAVNRQRNVGITEEV